MPSNKYPEYPFATIGLPSKDGGRTTPASATATATATATIDEKALVVGNVVTSEDGTETTIIDGIGAATTWRNGGRIISAPQGSLGFTVRYSKDVLSLSDPSYAPPEQLGATGADDIYA